MSSPMNGPPRAGRRIAVAGPRRFDKGAVAALALVVLALAAALIAASGTRSVIAAVGDPENPEAFVEHSVDGCPRFTPLAGTRTRVVTGSMPVDGLGSGGSLRHGKPGDGLSSATAQTPTRGELLRIEPKADAASLAVQADGELAAGLFTFEVDTNREGTTTAMTACASPGSSWWFTGGGATLDHSSELTLLNVDPGPAVLDVRVLGPEGEIDTIGTRGITVPPEQHITLALTDVAPQGEELAVSVVASRGRVVAAMSDTFSPGPGERTGADWLPPQTSPSRVLSLAGVPGRADSHTLLLANHSELESLVDVEVSKEAGSFTPTEDAQVRVPPRSVVSTDITDTIGRDPATITLRSTVPVTAAVRSGAGGDTSYAGSVSALTGPAVAPVVAGGTSTLALSAGKRAASADVTAYDEDGDQVGSTTLDIGSRATATWSPGPNADYLVVSPERGRIFGALCFAGDSGLSQVALRSIQVRVERPAVRPVVG